MIRILNRPDAILPTDVVFDGHHGDDIFAANKLAAYFSRFINEAGWMKAGPSQWLVVRGSRIFTPEDVAHHRIYSTCDGGNVTFLKRLLTVRNDWSRK